MKSMKTILVFLLTACLLFTALSMAACDKNGEQPQETDTVEETDEVCDDHIDIDGDNLCDICDAVVAEPVTYTVTLKDEDGTPMSGATVVFMQGRATVATGKTDANGTVTGSVLPGAYFVTVEDLPEGWLCTSTGSTLQISPENHTFAFTVVDNNPDGSEEKPFYIGDDDVTITFAAGATYYYDTKGAGKYLIINNQNAKVTYKGEEYLPENGQIRLKLDAAADTNSNTVFTITNTSNAENVIVAGFENLPGSAKNPYTATLDTALTEHISKEETVYYKWTATQAGYIMLTSDTADNHIMMHNITSQEATGYTAVGKSIYLKVAVGDVVTVFVGSSAENAVDVTFQMTFYAGTADQPLPVSRTANLHLMAGETVYLIYRGDAAKVSLPASSLTVTVNAQAQTTASDTYLIPVSDGTVLAVTNTKTTGYDISVTVIAN